MTETRFSRLNRAPAYKLVYDTIEADIVSGRLADGALLPTEGALAEQFGVHRSTVREGIRLLEQQGLIARGAAKRMVVAAPKTADTAARASKGLALHGVTFDEVWAALALFQPEAARLAARHMTPDALIALAAINDALGQQQSSEQTVESAFAFFQAIAAASGNRVILVQLQSLNLLIATSLARVIDALPNASARIRDAQKNLIIAFEARDADKAAEWMRKHIDDLRRGYEVAGVATDTKVV
ncbi:MAG: FCD domain-containing protein [Pseudomonadota bacterium]